MVPGSTTDAGLWLSSVTSTTTSAGSGSLTYTDGEAAYFTGSNLTLGATTAGNFLRAFILDAFALDSAADINACTGSRVLWLSARPKR